MDQRREKEGVHGYSYTHFDMIYATHLLKMGMDQRRKRGSGYSYIVILTRSMQLTG